jgi:5-formyltetrahydrofolate cyclo-ligase
MLRSAAKEALRKRLAALRRALTAEARQERGERMCASLLAHPDFQRAQVISAYRALRFEINPEAALEQAFLQGKRVLLPRVERATGELALHEYRQGDALEESGFAVPEPLASAPTVEDDVVDVVLVPGLAFDGRGYRLGYGKGFYDRLLPRLTRAVRIGLCFELSLLAEVPAAAHDQPVDFIVTDKRVIRCER